MGFLDLNIPEDDFLDKITEGMDPSEAALLRIQQKQAQKEEEVRRNKPHVATIKFNIQAFPMDAHGILDMYPVKKAHFADMGMNDEGAIHVKAANFCELAKKIDKILRYINDEEYDK